MYGVIPLYNDRPLAKDTAQEFDDIEAARIVAKRWASLPNVNWADIYDLSVPEHKERVERISG